MGDYLNYSAVAANNKMDGAKALADARTARNQAYAQAYTLDNDADAALATAGDNLMRMQRNKNAQLAAYRNSQTLSGFAHTGSKLAVEKSLAEVLDIAIADQMQSASASASNAYAQSAMLRHQGDTQLAMGSISKNFSDRLAAANRSYAHGALVGQMLQYPADIYFKFGGGNKSNNNNNNNRK